MSFRTRQAPSPTGYLHLGTTRQILFTLLLAKSNQGQWFLRVEDTDQNRLNPDAVTNLLQTLNELGIQTPEGVTLEKTSVYNSDYQAYQKGEFGPYIQSERRHLYQKYAQELIDKKLAYWNYLSPEEKEELQAIKKINHQPIDYFKINVEQFGEDKLWQSVESNLQNVQKPALMYRLKRNEKVVCQDLLLGTTEFDLSLEEDFTILKSDGFPTYHLAHLVDDFLMETNLVIRAQEWYASLPKHIVMFKELWGENEKEMCVSKNGRNVPDYLHLPFILPQVGNKKLSKRDGNVNMLNYLEQGYLPEALINYLAFLGWNPGTEQELYLDKNDFLGN